MIKYFCLFLFITTQALASADLGQELQLRKTPEGNFQFGVSFSYKKEDRALPQWNIFFGIDVLNAPSQLKWNIYNTQTKTFLVDWARQPVQNGRDLLVFGNILAKEELAKNIISNQDKILLVFGDPSGKALYYLDLGKMCREYPAYFMNLSEANVRCDQVSLP